METKRFSDEVLKETENLLLEVKKYYPGNLAIESFIKCISKAIVDYKKDGTVALPDTAAKLSEVINSLDKKCLSEAVKLVKIARDNCRSCMFHSDPCFMNLIFVAFKSVELGKPVELNKIRPNMRLSF